MRGCSSWVLFSPSICICCDLLLTNEAQVRGCSPRVLFSAFHFYILYIFTKDEATQCGDALRGFCFQPSTCIYIYCFLFLIDEATQCGDALRGFCFSPSICILLSLSQRRGYTVWGCSSRVLHHDVQ